MKTAPPTPEDARTRRPTRSRLTAALGLRCLSLGALGLGAPGLPSVARAQVPYVGIVSLVDIGARPGVQREAGRGGLVAVPGVNPDGLPLVELIHVQNLLACRAQRRASGGPAPCPRYEWSVPFIPEPSALKLEEALSRAWNEFDARSTWYMNSLLNTTPDPGDLGVVSRVVPRPVRGAARGLLGRLLPSTQGYSARGNCGPDEAGRVDEYLDAWNANPARAIDARLFCDALAKAQASARPSYKPGAKCAVIDTPAVTDWAEVNRRWKAAYTQAVEVYYPEYWQQVYAAVRRYMPGSLAWDGLYPLGGPVGTVGGAQLQPVFAPGRRTAQYQALARRAQAQDPNGARYILGHYPYPGVVGAWGPRVPRPATPPLGRAWPGISKLEVLKYGLAGREDIFARPGQWWSMSKTRGAAPTGPTGAGDLRETEGVGAVSFLHLYPRIDTLTTPRAAEYHRWCFLSYTPPVPVLVRRTLPSVAQGINATLGGLTRVHVRWETAPEGYPLHGVRGQPNQGAPGPDNLTGKLPTVDPSRIVMPRIPPRQVMERAPQAGAGADPPGSPPPPPAEQPSGAGGPGASGCVRPSSGTQSQCLARLILNDGRIDLGTSSSTHGGSPRQNILDAVNGRSTPAGCGERTPNCGRRIQLSARLLQKMLALADRGSYRVTAIAGGGHSGRSSHYTGDAIDIGTWAGIHLGRPSAGHTQARDACLAVGARPWQTFNAYNDPRHHSDHVHCDFR
ncbi:hypothetical protein [Deinococcus planocerae]|uniref:hypothetical protein n=1 Tax=Deinococcus planocerae TaxID=1737569 RepID=UPI000C7F5698|nr:hypothetical protein [Deinococcus planocerae]